MNLITRTKNARIDLTLISDTNGKPLVRVRYSGPAAAEDMLVARQVHAALKSKLGGFLPTIEKLEPGALFYANEYALPLSSYLAEIEFDLSERLTIARKIAEYLATLHYNGYTLVSGSFAILYFNPASLEVLLYDLTTIRKTHQKPGYFPLLQRELGEWFRTTLFPAAHEDAALPGILHQIIDKLIGTTSQYRSFNGLFRDVSTLSHQKKQFGKLSHIELDSVTPVISRVRESLKVQSQGLVALLDAFKRTRADKVEAVYLTGPDGIGKGALVDRLIQELPDYTLSFQLALSGSCTIPYAGVKSGLNTLLEHYVLNNEQKRRIFSSVANLRFTLRPATILGLIDEAHRKQLGLLSQPVNDTPSIPELIEEIRILHEIDPNKKVIAISGLAQYDRESKQLIAALINDNIITNTLFILTDESPDEVFVLDGRVQHVTLEPLTTREIERLIRNVFARHQFDQVGEIAEQIRNATGGLPNAIISVVDTAVQKGYFYQGIDERTWYCAPAFLKQEYLLVAEETRYIELADILERDEVSVVRAIAMTAYGASFQELVHATEFTAEKLDATLTRIIKNSQLIKRRNEAYFISREDRAEIREKCPLRVQKDLCLKFIEYLDAHTRSYSAREYAIRIAGLYLALSRLDTLSTGERMHYTRSFWAAAYCHYFANEIKPARQFLEAAIQVSDLLSLYEVDYELAKNMDQLAMLIYERETDVTHARTLFRTSMHKFKTASDRAALAYVYINILKARRQFQEAFDVGVDAIAALGYPIPRYFKLVTAMLRYVSVSRKLEKLAPDFFDTMLENTDPGVRIFHKISAQLVIVCYQYHNLSTYVPVIILNSLSVSFARGLTVELALSLMGYAYIKQMLPIKRKNEFIHGYYDIAQRILARFPKDEFVELFNDFVYFGILEPWRSKLPPIVEVLNEKYQRSVITSQPEIAGFFSGAKFLLSLESGANVKEVERSVELVLPEIKKLGQDTPITIHTVVLRTTSELGSLSPSSYREFRKFLTQTEKEHKKNYTVLFSLAYCGLLVSSLRREHLRALRFFASGLSKYVLGASGLPYLVRYCLYAFNSYSRLFPEITIHTSRTRLMLYFGIKRLFPVAVIASALFGRWARMYPEKYKHLYHYVLAERWLLQPLFHGRSIERFVDAFRQADEVGCRQDALIIGARIHELRTKYGLLEIGDELLEARVRSLAKASGIQNLIRAVGANKLSTHFSADHFKPYSVENIQTTCAQAIKDIQATGAIEKVSVVHCFDKQLIEVCRWEQDEFMPVGLPLEDTDLPQFEGMTKTISSRTDHFDEPLSVSGEISVFRSLINIKSGGEITGVLCIDASRPITDFRDEAITLVVQKLGLSFAIYKQLGLNEKSAHDTQRNHDRIAHINHEIRTPINGIVSLADKLQHIYAESPTQKEVKEYITHIANSAKNLLKIHQDVSSLQEIESGRLILKKACIDLHETLLTPFRTLQEMFTSKGLQLIIPSVLELPRYVMADATKISQIVYNLLHNSYKYTERGIVEGSIRFAVNGNYLSLEITICDTGVGIPKEYARRITMKGATTVNSPSSIKGSGIGLSVISRFCELMGGDLIIASEVAEGAAVSAIINLEIFSNPVVEMREMKKAHVDLSGLRVLCVDDDDTNLMAYAAKLQDSCCELLCAKNGWEALDLLSKTSIDLVLMDYDMPGSNGVDTAARAHTLLGENCPPIICVSAYDIQTIKRRHKNFDVVCEGFIEKIADNNAFIQEVARWLNREVRYSVADDIVQSESTFRWIDNASFLKVYGDNLYVGHQLIFRFLETHKNFDEKIRDLLNSQDRRALVSLFHQMKGQSHNIGAFRLGSESHRLMTLVDNAVDPTALLFTGELERFKIVLKNTFSELSALLETFEPESDKKKDANVERQLAEIETQLTKRSLLVMQRISELINGRALDASGMQGCIERIGKAVQEGNFEQAREMFIQLKETRNASTRQA